MPIIGVVFEHKDYGFSGKAHQVDFLVVPPEGECITIDFVADKEIDMDLAEDMGLAKKTDWFKVKRVMHKGGTSPGVDIFVAPVNIKDEL